MTSHAILQPEATNNGAIKRAGLKLAGSSDEFRKTFATPPELQKRIA